MGAHTPAPWQATKHTDTKGGTVSAGNSIASEPRVEAEANARLIAAAPELFRACRMLVSSGGLNGANLANAIDAARAAIAKADGE